MLKARERPRREGRAKPIFAYSNLDAIPVLFALGQMAAIIGAGAKLHDLGAAGISIYAIVAIILTTTMNHVVIHNFIHTRYFSSAALNFCFALICSAAVADTFTGQMLEHYNHHKHVNDQIDPTTGRTKDSASTYRFGRWGQHESMWRYSLLSPLRQIADRPSYNGRRVKMGGRIKAEVACIMVFWVGIGFLDFRVPLLWVIILYIAQVLTSAQNYFEHYGPAGKPGKGDSVSCYGRLYNFLWLNNGYHQEHHFRPGIHWTRLPELRCEMWPEEQRRVVAGAHFFNWPSKTRCVAAPSGLPATPRTRLVGARSVATNRFRGVRRKFWW